MERQKTVKARAAALLSRPTHLYTEKFCPHCQASLRTPIGWCGEERMYTNEPCPCPEAITDKKAARFAVNE